MNRIAKTALAVTAILLMTACGSAETITPDVAVSESNTQITAAETEYLLDPDRKFDSSADEDDTAYVIAEPENSDIKIYGVMNSNTVIIEHDGKADYFEQIWLTPRMILPEAYFSDYDSDGENELAVSYYVGSGTGVSVSELVVYEKDESGSFKGYPLYTDALTGMLNEKISCDIDNENHIITFTCSDSGKTYTADTSEDYPYDIESVQFGALVEYQLTKDKIAVQAKPNIRLFYECMPTVTTDVRFADGKFTLHNIELTDSEP